MEVNFLFSFNNKTIKAKVSIDQKVLDVLRDIISKNSSLRNIFISCVLSNGSNIDQLETFKSKNLKNNEVITVMCDEEGDNEEEETGPIQFHYTKELIKHAHVNLANANINAFIDRTFDVFKSLKNQYLLICSYSLNYKDYALLCVEITKEQLLFRKNNAHSERVFTCQHYLDDINHRDLLITGAFDKTIKIWNINNDFQLLYTKKPDYNYQVNTYLLSEALLTYNNNLYLITSAYELESKGYYILCYNLKNLKEGYLLTNSKDNCNYLETTKVMKIPLIIAANLGNIKIFDFAQKKLIKTFSDQNIPVNYLSTVIQIYRDKACLIATSSDGFLRIWDYNNPSIMVNKIKTYLKKWLIGLDLIDNRYLLAGCSDGSIKEFDLIHDCVALTFPRKDENDPLFTVKYIQINGKSYLFTHSHKGLIELWN